MVAPFFRKACQATEPLSKATFLAYLTAQTNKYNPATGTFGQANIFADLDDNQWDILSFNPTTKEVCVIIYNKDVEEPVPVHDTLLLGNSANVNGVILSVTIRLPANSRNF
jgi:hypothetical protein